MKTTNSLPFLVIFFFSLQVYSAGYTPLRIISNASAGNYVWKDDNRNGLQDFGEKGIGGVRVTIYRSPDNTIGNSDDIAIMYTDTDTDGYYTLENIPAESSGSRFFLRFSRLPIAFQFTTPLAAGAAELNSKVTSENADNGRTSFFTLFPGDIRYDLDAGLIAPAINTLPLHTLSLLATWKDNNVQLTWVAENEMSTSHFELQRAYDGQNYTDVAVKPVSGPLNVPTEYKHTDMLSVNPSAPAFLVFYRVKAIDNMGRFAYSNVATIKPETNTVIKLWPVPCTDFVNVFYAAGAAGSLSVSILNNAGQQLIRYTTRVVQGNNAFQITGIEQLPAGTYCIRLYEETTRKSTIQKMVRQ